MDKKRRKFHHFSTCLCKGVDVQLSLLDFNFIFCATSSEMEMPEISSGNPRLFSLSDSTLWVMLCVTLSFFGTSNVSRLELLPPKSISKASNCDEF